MNLEKRAAGLNVQTLAALDAPMARVLPVAVRSILARQAALIADLCIVVERLEQLIDLGIDEDDEHGD
jgi:hypothetical protein